MLGVSYMPKITATVKLKVSKMFAALGGLQCAVIILVEMDRYCFVMQM